MRNAHARPKRQNAVSRRHFVHIERFAVGRLAAMEFLSIERRNSYLIGFTRIYLLRIDWMGRLARSHYG